jgi:signal peptidase II
MRVKLNFKFAWIALLVVVLDLITKYLFSGFLNTGMAFGLFSGYNSLLIVITAFMIFILMQIATKYKEYRYALAVVVGGALGNLVDRILYSGVRDFINLSFWPAFNLADVAVVVGVIWIGVLIWKQKTI